MWEVDLVAFLHAVRQSCAPASCTYTSNTCKFKRGNNRWKNQIHKIGCDFRRDSSPNLEVSQPEMDGLQMSGCCIRHRTFRQHRSCQGIVLWLVTRLSLIALLLPARLQSVGGAESASFSCVYANSSSSQCESLCPQGCFYSFLPSYCSDEGLQVRCTGDISTFMNMD